MKIKKILVGILAVVLVFALFGCGTATTGRAVANQIQKTTDRLVKTINNLDTATDEDIAISDISPTTVAQTSRRLAKRTTIGGGISNTDTYSANQMAKRTARNTGSTLRDENTVPLRRYYNNRRAAVKENVNTGTNDIYTKQISSDSPSNPSLPTVNRGNYTPRYVNSVSDSFTRDNLDNYIGNVETLYSCVSDCLSASAEENQCKQTLQDNIGTCKSLCSQVSDGTITLSDSQVSQCNSLTDTIDTCTSKINSTKGDLNSKIDVLGRLKKNYSGNMVEMLNTYNLILSLFDTRIQQLNTANDCVSQCNDIMCGGTTTDTTTDNSGTGTATGIRSTRRSATPVRNATRGTNMNRTTTQNRTNRTNRTTNNYNGMNQNNTNATPNGVATMPNNNANYNTTTNNTTPNNGTYNMNNGAMPNGNANMVNPAVNNGAANAPIGNGTYPNGAYPYNNAYGTGNGYGVAPYRGMPRNIDTYGTINKNIDTYGANYNNPVPQNNMTTNNPNGAAQNYNNNTTQNNGMQVDPNNNANGTVNNNGTAQNNTGTQTNPQNNYNGSPLATRTQPRTMRMNRPFRAPRNTNNPINNATPIRTNNNNEPNPVIPAMPSQPMLQNNDTVTQLSDTTAQTEGPIPNPFDPKKIEEMQNKESGQQEPIPEPQKEQIPAPEAPAPTPTPTAPSDQPKAQPLNENPTPTPAPAM